MENLPATFRHMSTRMSAIDAMHKDVKFSVAFRIFSLRSWL